MKGFTIYNLIEGFCIGLCIGLFCIFMGIWGGQFYRQAYQAGFDHCYEIHQIDQIPVRIGEEVRLCL